MVHLLGQVDCVRWFSFEFGKKKLKVVGHKVADARVLLCLTIEVTALSLLAYSISQWGCPQNLSVLNISV